ncbi:MAG TPA: dephospho-CoA kinase [Dehalococcoidales bacterium]|nr:dephospho-CoA kinase [Dehalococcoidales bacterium]
MLVIGLTGGIGSGKSSVARILSELGASVIDADLVGHESYLPGTATYNKLIAAFGNHIVAPDGKIDRKKLGAIVFDDKAQLKKLNEIVLPAMKKMAVELIEGYRRRLVKVVVLEAPTLFESGWTDIVDQVWVVTAGKPDVIKRVMARSWMSEEAVQARIDAQLPDEARTSKADVVIKNDGSPVELRKQVKAFWEKAVKSAF